MKKLILFSMLLLSLIIEAKTFDEYETTIVVETKTEYTEDSALRMLQTIANNKVKTKCKNKNWWSAKSRNGKSDNVDLINVSVRKEQFGWIAKGTAIGLCYKW